MIYLNNAATTYPKPQCVLDAHVAALKNPPSNQFRSTESFAGSDIFTSCRKHIGELLGISDTERIFFAAGATDGLNRLIYGINAAELTVLTTQTEHNSVLRPLFNQKSRTNPPQIVPCDKNGFIDLNQLESYLKQNISQTSPISGLFILNHCSNVTGAVQDAAAIATLAHKYRFLFMLDASQSAGCIPVNADAWDVDLLAFTGHKALFGPQGTGGYFVRRGLHFKPMMFGGTGLDSSKLIYNDVDYEFEPGTQNAPGIAALDTGITHVLSIGVDEIKRTESAMIASLYEALAQFRGIHLYGDINKNTGPVLSFNIEGLHASDVAYILQNNHKIITRAGLHCAPLIHKALHTDSYGTVRISISALTQNSDIETCIAAIKEITESL